MGKLGKPQKSSKHKKLKCTIEQQKERPALLNDKKKQKLKNLTPVNEDFQEIPRKVKEIGRLQKDMSMMKAKTKKKKDKTMKETVKKFTQTENFKMERGMSRPLKPAPKFVQGKREIDRVFMRRVELETQRVLMTTHLEDKYKVDLTDPQRGNVMKRKQSERKREKDKERKKKKVQALKAKKLGRKGDFSSLVDNVSFGEVAMEPPSLKAKPRKANLVDSDGKPGKRSLLLKQIFEDQSKKQQEASPSETHTNIKPKSLANRLAGETVKRKHLSPAQKRITDTERENAIYLYRKLKNSKLQQR